MLRFWVTLYYGYWLFLLGLASFTRVRGQGPTPVFSSPDYVWWRGNAVTFQKYKFNGENCRDIAVAGNTPDIDGYSFNQNGAWLGGANKITFLMNGTSCHRVSTHRGEWVQMYFPSGTSGCGIGGQSGSMAELRYFDHPECRQNEWRNVVNHMEFGGFINGEGGSCFQDRGAGGSPIYYRAFCDVARPITGQITQTHVHPVTNITHYVNYVTNITTYVPTIVRPDDLIPLIETLMKRNSSMFKIQEVKPFFGPSPSPSPPHINSINAQNNTQSRSDASERSLFGPMVVLWGLLMVACFMRYSLYTFCFAYPRCLPLLPHPFSVLPAPYRIFQLGRCASKEKTPPFYRRYGSRRE